MKIYVIPAVLAAALSFSSCKPAASEDSADSGTLKTDTTAPLDDSSKGATVKGVAGASETQTVSLKVTGMRWGVSCVKKAQVALAAVEGVESTDVKLGSASVKGSAKEADLVAALAKVGFGATTE